MGFLLGAMQVGLCVAFAVVMRALDARDAIVVLLLTGALFHLFYVPIALAAIWEPPPDRDRDHCDGCGYPLFGLTSGRCPECGRPFDAALVAATPPRDA
jgi:hypothetical protein